METEVLRQQQRAAKEKWIIYLQHTSQDLQPAMALLARPTRGVELVEELAQKFGAMDGREAAGCAANLHAGGWSD